MSRGKSYRLQQLSGYIAKRGGKRVGFITYTVAREELEIMGLNSLIENQGTGSALVATVVATAKNKGMCRICLVTTTDNLNALGFWQNRGFKLAKIYPNAMEKTRKLKPTLPLIGENGIPLRDEIELEMVIS